LILSATSIAKSYGGVVALANAAFELRAGEVHALLGENGAGKSTLGRIIAGIERPDAGDLRVEASVAMIPQELDLFPNLTIAENIVAGNPRFRERVFTHRREMNAFARPFLEQAGLAANPREFVSQLSLAHRQMVAIARALSMDARILVMDEPTSALFADAAEHLFRVIRALRERGVAIVYVSHKMDEIFRVCDRATVMRDGATIGTRDIVATSADELIRMMVGRELAPVERARATPGETIFEVKDLRARGVKGVSLVVRRGEVVGIAGLAGAGRSELGQALARERGIALVPEDRKADGLMMQMSVKENSTFAILGRVAKFGFIDGARERGSIAPIFEELKLKAASADAPVASLSGGNQQKVLLARWLLADPEVLFLDDPARGIDVAAKRDIYGIIAKLRDAGKAVILVSSELPELLANCDRILVMREGRITGEFKGSEVTQEEIGRALAV
jgi:ABC-type sugar transport system ATPase subunit